MEFQAARSRKLDVNDLEDHSCEAGPEKLYVNGIGGERVPLLAFSRFAGRRATQSDAFARATDCRLESAPRHIPWDVSVATLR
jgi:hypothetical protein